MSVQRLSSALFLLLLVGLYAGCSSSPPPAQTATGPCAECIVCKYHNDLACLNVTVNDKTPTAVYNGKTYYFCSDECRNEFQKNPQKFLPMAQK